MLNFNRFILKGWKRLAQTSVLALLLLSLSAGLSGAGFFSGSSDRSSGLPSGNAITDGKSLLRYALPIDNQSIREAQASLEDIDTQLRRKRWSGINADITKAFVILHNHADDVLESVPEANKPAAEALIEQLNQDFGSLRSAVETQDKPQILTQKEHLLDGIGELEELMIQGFPFEVPEEYSNLPQLKGRATIQVTTTQGDVDLIVDGYSAPVTSGNFVDLVQRGFYDGLPFIRAEESYVLQAGDPPGKEQGFIDPTTGKYRAIPLEILAQGDTEPTYGITLEDAGRYQDLPVLPFSAYGAVAMARPEPEPNGGSSQFFFFLFEPELTPAGRNLLDGRYTVFGYVIEGKDVLRNIKQGDKIVSAKVIEGAENLVQPQA